MMNRRCAPGFVWSIAQMGMGYGVETVLTRLGQRANDIARFCFEGAVRLQASPRISC